MQKDQSKDLGSLLVIILMLGLTIHYILYPQDRDLNAFILNIILLLMTGYIRLSVKAIEDLGKKKID